MYLDVSSELLEEGKGVLRHGVDLGALPIAGLAAAGGGAHLCPTLVVGQRCLMHVAARGHPSRRAPAVLIERWPVGESAPCDTSSTVTNHNDMSRQAPAVLVGQWLNGALQHKQQYNQKMMMYFNNW